MLGRSGKRRAGTATCAPASPRQVPRGRDGAAAATASRGRAGAHLRAGRVLRSGGRAGAAAGGGGRRRRRRRRGAPSSRLPAAGPGGGGGAGRRARGGSSLPHRSAAATRGDRQEAAAAAFPRRREQGNFPGAGGCSPCRRAERSDSAPEQVAPPFWQPSGAPGQSAAAERRSRATGLAQPPSPSRHTARRRGEPRGQPLPPPRRVQLRCFPGCACPASRNVPLQPPGLCLPRFPGCAFRAARDVPALPPGLCLPCFPGCASPAARDEPALLPGMCPPSPCWVRRCEGDGAGAGGHAGQADPLFAYPCFASARCMGCFLVLCSGCWLHVLQIQS